MTRPARVAPALILLGAVAAAVTVTARAAAPGPEVAVVRVPGGGV